MEFLQSPDHSSFNRHVTNDSNSPAIASHNANNPTSILWSSFLTPSLTRNGAGGAATGNLNSIGGAKSGEGSKEGIKDSFRSLFSPAPNGISASPFLSGASYPYYPGITPYIAPSHSPYIGGANTGNSKDEEGDDAGNKKDVDRSALMTSPALRKAAKEAMAREFMNMPTSFMIEQTGGLAPASGNAASQESPSLSATSIEQTVPNFDEKKMKAKNDTSKDNEKSDEKAEEKQDELKEEVVDGGKDSAKKDEAVPPPMFPMYPMGFQGFPHHPPPHGMQAGMQPMPGMGYPFPMMFPAHAAPHLFMQRAPAAVMKEQIRANETPEEKKARIEREKEELIREFKKKTREAALVRFRQKRRERKFGKLIRYDCRKKLADARPRIKGRFVRVKEDDTQVVPTSAK